MGRPAEVTAEVTIISGDALKAPPTRTGTSSQGHWPAAELPFPLAASKEAARPQRLPGREARDADRLPLSSKDASGVSSLCQAL